MLFAFNFAWDNDLSLSSFLVLDWFWIFRQIFELFETTCMFIKEFRMFSVKHELKNGLPFKKNISLDFIATTMARIWGKTDNTSYVFIFFKEIRANDRSSTP
jgi:hypothetical protein